MASGSAAGTGKKPPSSRPKAKAAPVLVPNPVYKRYDSDDDDYDQEDPTLDEAIDSSGIKPSLVRRIERRGGRKATGLWKTKAKVKSSAQLLQHMLQQFNQQHHQ